MVALILALVVSALICGGLSAYAARLRHLPGALAFAANLAGCTLWTLAYTAALLLPGLEFKLIAWQIQMVGVVLLPASLFLFAVAYALPDRAVTPKTLALLAVEPILVVALAWTNSSHRLMLSDVWLLPLGPFEALGRTFGPGMLLHTIYSSGVVLMGMHLLLGVVLRTSQLYRLQAMTLLFGVLVPTLTQIAWIARIHQLVIDPTPFAFAVSGAVVTLALTRLRLFDLAPVARETLFHAMPDPVFVLDERGRILDANTAAGRLVGLVDTLPPGATLESLLAGRVAPTAFGHVHAAGGGEIEIADPDRAARHYELYARAVHPHEGVAGGKVLVLRDVTERKATSARLAALNTRLSDQVDARDRSLRRQRLLLSAARHSAARVDPDQLLQTLANAATEATNARRASVYHWDEGEELLRLVRATDDPTETAVIQPPIHSAVAQAVRRGKPTRLANDRGFEAAVPLLHEGRLLGALEVKGAPTLDDEDLDTLELLATNTAAALAAYEWVRLEGVLLAARTAQHELSNRLAITAGYASLLAADDSTSERARGFAREAERGALEASELLHHLAQVTRIEETHWGEGVQPTINLREALAEIASSTSAKDPSEPAT